jgi:myo-inositol-1(or 4)-monophosphatase
MENRPVDERIHEYFDAASAAADEAAVLLSSYYGNLRHVSEKEQAGLVTEADKESEAIIVGRIKKLFPEHRILGEESGLTESQNKEKSSTTAPIWFIDPLDGTTNYVHQFPVFGISIGLEIDNELVLGIVEAPKLGMRWSAIKGKGAFMNGERIRVSSRNQFRDGLYATGFSSIDDNLEAQMNLLRDCVKDARGIRRAGAAALDLCFVAQGIFDVFWEKNLNAWDTAAGTLIAREAGAIVTDFEGRPYTTKERHIIAGNPYLHPEVLKRLHAGRVS